MITVRVHLHTALRSEMAGASPLALALPAGSRLADLIERLHITFPLDALLLVVNRRAVSAQHELADGDVIHLIPEISGGEIAV